MSQEIATVLPAQDVLAASSAAPAASVVAKDQPGESANSEASAPTAATKGFVSWVRDKTPASLVNSGTEANFAFKASADGLSVWSSVRKGSASPARLVASSITLLTEILGIFYKEKEIQPEKQREYREMSWPKYVLVKTKEAFNPKDHILETVGLATIANGVFTTISGIAQSSKNHSSWEKIQGAMTVVAGMLMSYMPDREKAWQLSTIAFWTRAPAAYMQAKDAYFKGNPEKNIQKGDWQQAAKWVLNQTSNLFGFFYGGVKKMPDGSIIHIGKKGNNLSAPREHKTDGAIVVNETTPSIASPQEPAIPQSVITSATELEHAMPSPGRKRIIKARLVPVA